MDKLVLIKPDISFKSEIQSFRKEMLEVKSSMDGTGPLHRMDNIEEWLEFNKRCENEETLPQNLVRGEQYIYVIKPEDRIVGMIQIRHYFNDFLEKYGGHIGYSVRPNERRKGYAKKMLVECLKICKSYELNDVLITCIQGNEGSKRTILANGGIYEKTVYCEPHGVYLDRHWIHL